MTEPTIYGPFNTYWWTANKAEYSQDLYKSKPMHRRPLPYFRMYNHQSGSNYWNWVTVNLYTGSPQKQALDTRTYAKAYDKWHKMAGDKAQMVLNLLEAEKSMMMIVKRAQQLIKFVRSIKNLRFGDAYDALDISRDKRKLIKAKSVPDAWLEFTFGWSPLIQDIGAAIGILQREFPVDRIRAKANLFDEIAYNDGGRIDSGVMKVSCTLSGGLKVTNPNLFLANQLGFVNPIAVAWDAVPFSFVVDWFIPVNKFLNSMSNDYGLEVDWPCVSRGVVMSFETRHVSDGFKPAYCEIFSYQRKLQKFHKPGLLDRAHLPQMSNWLAATSISLLMQQLITLRKRG